jgi:hypothetical protein
MGIHESPFCICLFVKSISATLTIYHSSDANLSSIAGTKPYWFRGMFECIFVVAFGGCFALIVFPCATAAALVCVDFLCGAATDRCRIMLYKTSICTLCVACHAMYFDN